MAEERPASAVGDDPRRPGTHWVKRKEREGKRLSSRPLACLRESIWLRLLPALSLIAVLFGASVMYGVMQSLGYLPFLNQRALSLNAYRNVLFDPNYAAEFRSGLLFSLWISGASTVLSTVGALLVVALIGPRVQRQRRTLLALNANLAFPHLVWAIGLLLLLAQSGLLARVAGGLGLIDGPRDFPVLVRDGVGAGVILAYVTKEVPFLALIALGALAGQPTAYMQIAENLGATAWQRLRYVTLPLVLPGLLSGALLVFAFVFGAYEVPQVLGTRYPQMVSVVALEFFLNPDLSSRAEGMAVSVLMALVVLVVALGARRVRVTG